LTQLNLESKIEVELEVVMGTERNIQWYSKTRKIDQIPDEGLEYAFVSKNYEQIHQLVWCKDFMQDAIHGFINNMAIRVYGFAYDPKKSIPLYLRKTRLMIANWKDKEFSDKIPALLDFLHQIEAKLKITPTVAVKCKNPPNLYKRSGVWVLNGSNRWMNSPPMISLYTLLIRLGLVHKKGTSYKKTIQQVISLEIGSYYGDDSYQLSDAHETIEKILKHGDRRLFYRDIKRNYPPNLDTQDIMHEACGLVSYAAGYTRGYFPYWHRFDSKV
jgi:hypothetical protein